MIVEIDGATHSTDDERARDGRRTRFLAEQGHRVLRFTNESVFENIDGVLEEILRALGERLSPDLSPQERGEEKGRGALNAPR